MLADRMHKRVIDSEGSSVAAVELSITQRILVSLRDNVYVEIFYVKSFCVKYF